MSRIWTNRTHLPRWRRWMGLLPIIGLVVVAEVLRRFGIHVPGYGVVLLAALVLGVLQGGTGVGFFGGLVALTYFAFYLASGRAALAYTEADIERLVILVGAVPITVLIVGRLTASLDELFALEQASRSEAKTQEERAIAILDNISESFFAVDVSWQLTYVNRHAERMVGMRRGELLGHDLWQAFPALVGSVFETEFRRAVRDQVAVRFEAYYASYETWFDTSAYPSPEGLAIYTHSINERKQAEEQLRTRLRQQEAVARLSQQCVEDCSLQHLFDDAVTLVADGLGVEMAKLLELLPSGDRMLLRAGVGWHQGLVGQAVVEAGIGSQAGYTLASGTPVIVSDLRAETRFSGPALLTDHGVVSGLSVIIGGADRPFGVLGAHGTAPRTFTAEDVTFLQAIANELAMVIERHATEDRRRETEQRFHQLADNVRDVFWIVDPASARTLYVSPACERIWGRSIESMDRQPGSWKATIHAEDREVTGDPFVPGHVAGDYVRQFRIVRPDGEVRWIRSRGFPIRDAAGQIVRVAGVAEDITETKQAEADTRRLIAAHAEAQARDDILAMVAHDLRNPLNLITLSGGFLEQLHPTEQQQRMLHRILGAAARMNRLIHDLLDVTRIEAGQLAIHPRRCDVAGLVKEACDLMSAAAEQKGQVLSSQVPAHLPQAHVDRERISQVLENLIGNAIKFTPEGGQITVTALAQGAEVVLSVSDTGPGIPRAQQAHLFERFWQAQKADRHGIGLGLAIVKGIIDAHGGSVGIESRPGQGSTFTVHLPVA